MKFDDSPQCNQARICISPHKSKFLVMELGTRLLRHMVMSYLFDYSLIFAILQFLFLILVKFRVHLDLILLLIRFQCFFIYQVLCFIHLSKLLLFIILVLLMKLNLSIRVQISLKVILSLITVLLHAL